MGPPSTRAMPMIKAIAAPSSVETTAMTAVTSAPFKSAGRNWIQLIGSSRSNREGLSSLAGAEILHRLRARCVHALLAQAVARQDLGVGVRLLELHQFIVEGLVEFLVLGAEVE